MKCPQCSVPMYRGHYLLASKKRVWICPECEYEETVPAPLDEQSQWRKEIEEKSLDK